MNSAFPELKKEEQQITEIVKKDCVKRTVKNKDSISTILNLSIVPDNIPLDESISLPWITKSHVCIIFYDNLFIIIMTYDSSRNNIYPDWDL